MIDMTLNCACPFAIAIAIVIKSTLPPQAPSIFNRSHLDQIYVRQL